MSLNTKITLVSLVLLIGLPVFAFWKYKSNRPEPVIIPGRTEIDITIIPGWNIKQIAENWVDKDIVSSTADVFEFLGAPEFENWSGKLEKLDLDYLEFPLLETKPKGVSFEGYLMPDTYRIYQDSSLEEVLSKIFTNLENKITKEMRAEMKKQGRDFYEILTMASVVEREARTPEDMAMVADIFWRRLDVNWALQSCATVNYITGKNDPAVNGIDKEIDSPYNTYKYPGLPPGPVSNPGPEAIYATIYPDENNYWYFMSGTDGVMHYGKTLDEHNSNVYKYLR